MKNVKWFFLPSMTIWIAFASGDCGNQFKLSVERYKQESLCNRVLSSTDNIFRLEKSVNGEWKISWSIRHRQIFIKVRSRGVRSCAKNQSICLSFNASNLYSWALALFNIISRNKQRAKNTSTKGENFYFILYPVNSEQSKMLFCPLSHIFDRKHFHTIFKKKRKEKIEPAREEETLTTENLVDELFLFLEPSLLCVSRFSPWHESKRRKT